MHFKLRIRNAGQIVCVRNDGARQAVGTKEMNRVDVVTGPASIVVGVDGRIAHIGTDAEVAALVGSGATFDSDIDAKGSCVLPGLVDAHTHPIWAGDRVHEFAMKLAGATYLDIHKAGGGIGFTVRHTREATDEQLAGLLKNRLDRMLRLGTTLAEAKSGYGLDTESELKQLRIIHNSKHHVELVGTFLGAHSVPAGTTAAKQTDLIVNEMIPAVAAAMKRGEISPEFVDVFHEQGVFEYDDSKRILEAGRAVGLTISFHGDELHYSRSGELGGELGAQGISHLELVSDDGIAAMAKKPTFAVMLPTTAYLMRLKPPPARKLITGNVPVALGSDYNPNAHCLSMPETMNQACVLLGMTMEEALVAGTINAAAAIGRSADYGSLEKGKWGDILIMDAPRWEHLIYEMADPPISRVFKKGICVYQAKN